MMFSVLVKTKKGTLVGSYTCEQAECLLGKTKESLVAMAGWKVADVHARLQCRENGLYVVDQGHRTGTGVNGRKVQEYGPLAEEDVVEISDYRLHCRLLNTPSELRKPAVGDTPAALESVCADNISQRYEPDETPRSREYEARVTYWRERIRRSLVDYMDLRRVNVADMSDQELRNFTAGAIDKIIRDQNDIDAEIDQEELARQVLAEAVGLGPLEPLLADESISEIMVNARDEIYYERNGRLNQSRVTFTDDTSVISAIERIVSPLGRRIDESSPMVDARLKDGSRVNAVIPPLALKGPNITIRKFMKERLTAQHMRQFGSLSAEMVDFLELAVRNRKNVVISGGTGSGKTTLLNVLSNFIPDSERIITVEDAAELKLYQPNLVSLEARPANQEGRGAINIRDLVRNCLRMRPDRIVVGECRGGEALDMLQAMNTGHDGSLTTIHSNSPRDCISRLEVLVLMSGMDLPVHAIREQIASAVDIIVQQTRFACGSRKVTSIAEVTGLEGGVIQLSEIYRFQQKGYDQEGRVRGDFTATGAIPDFVEELRERHIDVDMNLFHNQAEAHGF
ncbi:FHA domain-containing protein [Alcanivorax hongdengensis A-11-3]|uniref:FHA domain-containing protein n=1 Tax=Alcanivorax hongdengensis A-11-3 TaxID=1177179 RepID=L0WCN2_9GAMM|nr:ATPase, T2SS/T4P/T4SS family [Alcanivorax hongdengensis]EKF73867.1 FHA domain-containing protein [Alcanivorax hongdengensis A-11-3]